MEYIINGSKVKVKRETVDTGLTIMEGLINSFIIKNNEPKGETKNDESNIKEQK